MTTTTKSTEFLFIDANVADKQTLIDSAASNIKVVELNDKTTALSQIAAALKGVKNLDAIHIISHGAEGELQFANGVLNNENLSTYKSQLKKIGASLSKDGDILLYGCDVAGGENGSAFINSLAKLTKADVAASDNATGAAVLGGDWVLETHTGAIESLNSLNTQKLLDYSSLLIVANPAVNTTFSSGSSNPIQIGSNTGTTDTPGTAYNVGNFGWDVVVARDNPISSVTKSLVDLSIWDGSSNRAITVESKGGNTLDYVELKANSGVAFNF